MSGMSKIVSALFRCEPANDSADLIPKGLAPFQLDWIYRMLDIFDREEAIAIVVAFAIARPVR